MTLVMCWADMQLYLKKKSELIFVNYQKKKKSNCQSNSKFQKYKLNIKTGKFFKITPYDQASETETKMGGGMWYAENDQRNESMDENKEC